MKRNDIVYYARIIPNSNLYDVYELKIRTVEDTYFTGIEKFNKQVFLFNNSELNKTVFYDKKQALNLVKEAEKNKKEVSDEKFYEEY